MTIISKNQMNVISERDIASVKKDGLDMVITFNVGRYDEQSITEIRATFSNEALLDQAWDKFFNIKKDDDEKEEKHSRQEEYDMPNFFNFVPFYADVKFIRPEKSKKEDQTEKSEFAKNTEEKTMLAMDELLEMMKAFTATLSNGINLNINMKK